jgi:ABC-type sugar transport system ATPase subunit
MSGIAFEGVSKRFGDVTAVAGLDLAVEDEEFLVLLGPSGCGKTTVLRLIAGLDSVSEGTLSIGDRVVNDVEAKDRDIAMVFQSYALYPHLDVYRNVESPLVARRLRVDGERRHLTKAERDERVREVTTMLGLGGLLRRKPAALSGGQRQRVALARAIVSRPAAFLMDEPLSNLDAALRAQTRVELADLHRRLATTFVYVTHDQVEAMTMADRLAILDAGRLQQVGTPREVYESPRNLFVARFIGSPPMNTLDGTFALVEGRPAVDVAGTAVPITPPAVTTFEPGRPVVLGVRPEHLSLGTTGLVAEVRAVEWLGNQQHVIVDIVDMVDTGGHRGTGVTVALPPDEPEPSVGKRVHLRVDPAAVPLFDPVSTERLA